MTMTIKRAAVIGAGTMGSGIAALLAGVGIDTLLLDIPAPDTQPEDDHAERNAFALRGIERLKQSRPPELYVAADLDRIRVGNIEDDLGKLSDVDWIIEVVVEKLAVKRDLFVKLNAIAKPNAILSTNTSGLPIAQIAEGMGDDFKRRFMGTHFFNPPRYLHLLELIAHPDCDPGLVRGMTDFLAQTMGKGVVIANDTPNFIGNRFLSILTMHTLAYALDHGFTVDEIDSLTGPLIGRPKTGTFRLSDLVGNDVFADIAENLYPAIPDDPQREVLAHPKAKAIYDRLLANDWLGNKRGAGFYKRVKLPDGGKAFWTLDFATHEHSEPQTVRFESVGKHRKVGDTTERIKRLLAEDDRAAQFLWDHHAFYLTYAAGRVPEITDSLINIDNAQKWGFVHDAGPFEIWDALGVAETIPAFAEKGYAVPAWVEQMVASGKTHFYQRDEHGRVIGYYSPQAGDYVALESDPREIQIADRRAAGHLIKRNAGANVVDLGDGIALLEMTTDKFTIDDAFVMMGLEAADLLDRGMYRGLVVSHDGNRFSIGANLMLVLLAAQNDQFDQIETLIKGLQNFTLALRYAKAPVVMAPFDMALGGGAEILLAGHATVSHAELYTGLVEFNVGLIPAGAGTKSMMQRAINPVARTTGGDVRVPLQQIYQQMITAKVSTSAKEAMAMHMLTPDSPIIMNRAHLTYEAKQKALELAADFAPRDPEPVYVAGGAVYTALRAELDQRLADGQISEYDALIADKLAGVITGGADAEAGWVDEQTVLDWECEVFMELTTHPKTHERITHMLKTNKPLRN